ncbi:hypothetical protein KUTeg_023150 [Tegillarca granosa]|uniref:WD repeat-containing protein 76 n=1 Tax=Tegillarca granosa TaxID=220873 RepID=A0ABQ9E1T7_TEGGR|nr:hypothetical protein KUTeg_023150 [Tegillarca granosa]
MPATRRSKRNRSESANEQSQSKKKKIELKKEIDVLENEFDSEAENKSKMYESQKVKLKSKPSRRGLKDYKEKNNEPTVRRLSLRLQQKDPEGIPLPPDAFSSGRATFDYEPINEHPRKPSGPLNMEDQLYKEDLDDHNELMDHLQKSLLKKIKVESPGSQSSKDSFVKNFTKITLSPERVAKVVPERIFSVAVHPSNHVTLAVAGDKWGRIGLWNVVYATPEDDDNLLKNFDFISPDSLIVAQQDGTVAVVDTRIKKDSAESIYTIHNKAFRSVSVHPLQTHIFTSAGDGIYDASDVGNLKIACSFKEDLFVSGSMSRPRQIELYGVDGKLIQTFKGDDLGSVCSLNEIHPTRNVLVGGNSSGRLHVFM